MKFALYCSSLQKFCSKQNKDMSLYDIEIQVQNMKKLMEGKSEKDFIIFIIKCNFIYKLW